VKPYFDQVEVRANVVTSEPQARIDELQKTVDLRCPVFRTFKDAGIPIKNNWVKAAITNL
jgi:putative redox protein